MGPLGVAGAMWQRHKVLTSVEFEGMVTDRIQLDLQKSPETLLSDMDRLIFEKLSTQATEMKRIRQSIVKTSQIQETRERGAVHDKQQSYRQVGRRRRSFSPVVRKGPGDVHRRRYGIVDVG